MKLISLDYALEILSDGVTSDDVKKTLEQGEWFGIHAPDDVPDRGNVDLRDAERLLGYAVHYASSRNSLWTKKDVASYAALVQYFATGIYSGFGTELYEKEVIIRNILTALTDTHSETSGLRTQTILTILEMWFFGDKDHALYYFINSFPSRTMADILISLATVSSQSQNLAVMVNNFLNKKAKPKELREAVRKIIPKVAPQLCEPRKQTKLE